MNFAITSKQELLDADYPKPKKGGASRPFFNYPAKPSCQKGCFGFIALEK